MSKTIKLFTHNDLDGISCVILAQLAYGEENVDYEICNYEDVNEKITNFLHDKYFIDEETGKDITYDKIFITDISVDEDVAELIDMIASSNVILLDHHPTALWLNKYSWAKVQIEDEIEKVKRYDTWLWTEKYNDIEAKQINDLLHMYGREKFINKMYERLWLLDEESFLDETDKLILELERDKISRYIDSKNKSLIKKDLTIKDKTYKVEIVFAENYISQLGNELSKRHEDLDFIAIISNMETISYRTVKGNIDLGKDIASFYDGGGHPKAAGSQISKDLRDKILELVLW